jgi:hypothetical protein
MAAHLRRNAGDVHATARSRRSPASAGDLES